jgi:hypothetical protein
MDSEGAMELAGNHMLSKRTKHVDTQYHYIRQAIKVKEVKLEHVPGIDNTADAFTKALSYQKFIKHRKKLGVARIEG